MEQNQEILEQISNGTISDPAQCVLGYSVFWELLESVQIDQVLIDYDQSLDEVYMIITRNGYTSICLPRSVHDKLDLTVFDKFRKKQIIPDMDPPNQ